MRRLLAITSTGALLLGAAPAAAQEGGGGVAAPGPGPDVTGGASYGAPPAKDEGTADETAAKRRRAAARRRRLAAKRRRRARQRAARRGASRAPTAQERAERRRARQRRRRERSAVGPGDSHVFPVAGDFSLGGDGSRFGARRPGHVHQGQDIAAPLGTPVVAPWAGTIEVVRFQAQGAGHYVVLDGAGEDRDYVFMHLRPRSILVAPGETVRRGQQLAQVGSSGGSSGPHLHFEIWKRGGWYTGGRPVDPLPFLRAWLR